MVLGALIFVSYLNLLYKQTARADCRGGWELQVLVIPLQTSNNIFKKLGHHHVLLTSVNVVVIFCDIYVSDYGACVNSVYDNSQYLEGIHERAIVIFIRFYEHMLHSNSIVFNCNKIFFTLFKIWQILLIYSVIWNQLNWLFAIKEDRSSLFYC